jgi:pimeloyl-ACP methyl ester carboxylesterase
MSNGPKDISFILEGTGSRRLVFIHGLCGKKEFFEAQIKFFSSDFEVLSVDLPCHGKSTCVENKNFVQASAKLIAELLSSLDTKETILIGHSMGGWIVNALSSSPFFPKACVFVDSPCLYSDDKVKDYHDWGRKILESENPKQFIKDWFTKFISDECTPDIAEQVVGEGLKYPHTWIADFMKSTSQPKRSNWKGEVFVMEGTQYYPPGNPYSWLELFPSAKQWHYPKMGHYFFLEDAQVFNLALKSFLNSL